MTNEQLARQFCINQGLNPDEQVLGYEHYGNYVAWVKKARWRWYIGAKLNG